MFGLKITEFYFLLGGLKWTVLLSLIGMALGSIAGLFIALARSGRLLPVIKSKALAVEPRGIEPLTSCLQSRRSTN